MNPAVRTGSAVTAAVLAAAPMFARQIAIAGGSQSRRSARWPMRSSADGSGAC